MENLIVRASRVIAMIATVAVLAALVAAPAGAQGGTPEIRLESTGPATATLDLGGGVVLGPLPTNTEHPYGWTGNGSFRIVGGTSCRIIADGSVVAEGTSACQWP